MCRGMRSVFVPQAVTLEPGHSWQLGLTALVLMAWIVAGLVLCLTNVPLAEPAGPVTHA